MKIILAASLLSAVAATDRGKDSVFRPHRVSLSDLELSEAKAASPGGAALLKALQTHGIVAIKDLSLTYSSDKNRALSALYSCISSSPGAAKSSTFSDGTVRHTLASRTVPGPGGMQKIKVQEESGACKDFVEASTPLREAVNVATQAFTDSLGVLLELDTKNPILSTEDGSHDFSSFGDVAEAGEHLEHFHSYRHPTGKKEKQENVRKLAKGDTIELHTDQGLFIAFTPGMIANQNELSPSGGFYIQDDKGARSLAHFDSNDLVIMLGDGIEQIGINDRLREEGKSPLRSTPHAMVMPSDAAAVDGTSRVWHGRMVLPPSGAIHPSHSSSGKTFGDVRRALIESSLDSASSFVSTSQSGKLSLGCSSPIEQARILADEDVSCAEDSTYCWHRCMPHEDRGINVGVCAQRNLQLQCINPREQVYISGHGDFYPACSNSSEPASDYPTLPDYPRDEATCTVDAWKEFSKTDGYTHVFDRLGDNRGNRGFWEGATSKGQGKVAKFMWNVAEDGETIDGKLVFNNLFGYLAIGIASEGGKHNGMNGASIIMAIPGGNYSSKLGLDLGMDDTVLEYEIDHNGSSFRHWSDPLSARDTSSYSHESTECFTSLSFKTDNINDNPLVNATGMGDLVWAGNPKDYFCGSHGRGQDGRGDRDRFAVDWKTGKGWFPAELEEEHKEGDETKDGLDAKQEEQDGTEGTNGGETMSSSSATWPASNIGLVVLGIVMATANIGGFIV